MSYTMFCIVFLLEHPIKNWDHVDTVYLNPAELQPAALSEVA